VTAPDLYVRDGSRFVVYSPSRQHTPPIPVPASEGPSPEQPIVEVGSGRYAVYAARCPHGRFRGCRARGCPGPA
jgi:hypothetical protein